MKGEEEKRKEKCERGGGKVKGERGKRKEKREGGGGNVRVKKS